jgi:hypothetical protein
MATETRTVTDEDRILAGIVVAEVLEEFEWLAEEDFERLRKGLMEELLWTSWGRRVLVDVLREASAEPT